MNYTNKKYLRYSLNTDINRIYWNDPNLINATPFALVVGKSFCNFDVKIH